MSRRNNPDNRAKPVIQTSGKSYLPVHILSGIIISIIAIFLYINTLNHDYALDDVSVINHNQVVKKGIDGIPTILITSYRYGFTNAPGTLYRPLSLIMFALEWHLFPNNPHFSHLINILLYSLTGFLLFITLRRLLLNYNIIIPFIISLLFISHPVHTEVVANIKSRDEILCFLFFLVAIYSIISYIRKRSAIYILIAAMSYFLALMSKENAVVIIVIFPLTLYFFFKDVPVKKIILISSIFLIPLAGYMMIRYTVLGSFAGIEELTPLDNMLVLADTYTSKLATTAFILGKYLLLLLIPHPLTSDYSYSQIPLINLYDYRALISIILYIGMLYFALRYLRKKSLLSYGILFYLITISLVSNLFIMIGSSLSERFLFLPSLGYCFAIVALIITVFKTGNSDHGTALKFSELIKQNKTLIVFISIILVFYSIKTITRNSEWKNNYSLFGSDIKKSSESAKMHFYYGLSLMKDKAQNARSGVEMNNYLNKAILEFREAINIYDSYEEAYDETGLAYFRKGDYGNAMEYFNRSLQFNPNKPITYNNIGSIYYNKKKFKEAKKAYLLAIKYDPHLADAHYNLGNTYGVMGELNEALGSYNKALEYNPQNAKIYNMIGITYRYLGDTLNAALYFDKAYQLDPGLKK